MTSLSLSFNERIDDTVHLFFLYNKPYRAFQRHSMWMTPLSAAAGSPDDL